MGLALLSSSFALLLVGGYFCYGRWVARQFDIGDHGPTPAHRFRDGLDFEPTRPFYLFAQHFSAIAAAGPIAGPILACQQWGWGPCLLWIALGVVLIGAVHDFSSLTISVRHDAHSIAEIARTTMGQRAGTAMMIFIWLSLIYVIIAFTDITAASFVGKTEELAAAQTSFNPGGAVAAAACMYLLLSLLMGVVERYLKPPLWLSTLVFVPLAFSLVWCGTKLSTILIFDAPTWCVFILGYCFIASLLPVWLLMQPRGYLGGFFLYSVLLLGVCGIFFGGFSIKQELIISEPTSSGTGAMLPFLFVTIACGACSGFHGLVCSGTTSKQIDKEAHLHPVGYGAMLCEAFVALIALTTIMIWAPADIVGLKPGTIYGKGIGEYLSVLIGREHLAFATTFGAMAFSTFVFDTLDVSTRLGRYLVQELLGRKDWFGALLGTAATIGVPLWFILNAQSSSYLQFWTLFGASNQLLAALTLLTVSVWLHNLGKRTTFVVLPLLFILTITLWALVELIAHNLAESAGLDVALLNAGIGMMLLGLALYLVGTNLRKSLTPSKQQGIT